MSKAPEEFIGLIREALADGSFVKLTLGAPRGPDDTLRNVQVRAIDLRAGPRLSFVYHHTRRDITRNLSYEEAFAYWQETLGLEFQNAHLFTTRIAVQLEFRKGREPRLVRRPPRHQAAPSASHDRSPQRLVPADRPWLLALGVTAAGGRIAAGMEAKYRQINKFVEILAPLLTAAGLDATGRLDVVDMGSGKGYLTLAIYDWLRQRPGSEAQVRGIEARPELVELCNSVARDQDFSGLKFIAGNISETPPESTDVLIALHACDTATDDAIATGITAGARLIIVSPCCHKELRPRLIPPPPLAGALRHGILAERQAEFITDALRAALLEWAGYTTKVFEFISTEHTAKNLMIAAVRRSAGPGQAPANAERVQALAGFYGIRSQRLAERLGFKLIGG